MGETVKKKEIKDFFVDLFTDHSKQILEGSPDYINDIRYRALDEFRNQGFPGRKIEKYKYTNLEPVFQKSFNYHFNPKNITFNIDDLFKCDVPDIATITVILLNGFFYEPINPLHELPEGMIISSFSKATKEHPQIVDKHYSKYAGYQSDGLVALNTAFVRDGIFVYLPKNTVMDKPLQIINLLLSQEEILVQHRNLFVFEENSAANFVVCDHTLSPHSYLTNSVTEIFAGRNAHFDLTRMQNEHNSSTQVTNTFIHQLQDSNVTTNTITLHGGLVRNNINVDLTEPGAENQTMGLYLLDHGQHVDNFVNINHFAPHCTSNQLFKGVLDDYSTGAFNGKIYVAPDAQKTMAYQVNRNLLLTNEARMNSKPQLEIYADDVKCSHGATVGQLDPDALFYLRSRGIDINKARLLMMYAFANEISDKIKIDALRTRVDDLVNKRLRGELSRCNTCALHCC